MHILKAGNLLHPVAMEMWGHLRAATLHYLTLTPDGYSSERRKEAHNHLLKYAKMAEKVCEARSHVATCNCIITQQGVTATACTRYSQYFPEDAGTSNLHVLLCRLVVQEEERGEVARCTEFWVERAIQEIKRVCKFRASTCPEKVRCLLALAGTVTWLIVCGRGCA